MSKKLEIFAAALNLLRQLTPFAAVNYIKSGMGYGEFLLQYAIRHRLNPEDLLEILEGLMESAKPWRSFHD